ncbi:MAG: hypothetical protein GXP30_05600 [Verrucomicrobia bacterium]|nr:hypothetical protein [Verrucomicrobiota bacterium]
MKPRTITAFIGIFLSGAVIQPVVALDYKRDIMPILVKKCSDCHSTDSKKAKAGLRFDDPVSFQKRMPKNDTVLPGDWDASLLFITITRPHDSDDAMPPKGKGDSLSKDEIRTVQKWITEGAPINGDRGKRGKMPAEDAQDSLDLPGTKPKEQAWKNKAGKTIMATLLKVEKDVAVLRLRGGRIYRYPIANLSEESQAMLKKKD